MRRSLLPFILGFISGILALTVALAASGKLKNPAPVQASAVAKTQPPAAASQPGPESNAGDIQILQSQNLSLPLNGLKAADLHDTFTDQRSKGKHEALDILAPRGTPVLAIADGKVAKLFYSRFGGNTVYQFDTNQVYCFYYAHLDRYAEGLTDGMLLHKGDTLGYVGTSGDAPPDTPHLHLAFFKLGPDKHWWQGTAINPYPIFTHR